jgi:ubiquinone/menaquinone biosynthesis C-methylase UbiE
VDLPIMSTEPPTERVRAVYERFADRYDRIVSLWDRVLSLQEARRWIASRAIGDVLEVGVGTGLNLPFYSPDIRLTGVDLSAAMLRHARRRITELEITVDLVEGDAQALPFRRDRFDTVVFGLCLCSIPDDRGAVAEGVRVLKPGGRMLVLEHVRSTSAVVRAGQRLIEPLSIRVQADHLLREPIDHLRVEGMQVDEVRRWAMGIMERAFAHKPGDDDR